MYIYPRLLLITLSSCALLALITGGAGRFVVVLVLLLLVPGYLFERLLPSAEIEQAWLVRPALWIGLSLSLVALLYQWVTVVGLALSPLWLGVLLGSGGLAALWLAWHDSAAPVRLPPVALLFILILLITLWNRFEQIRALALPAWVDSVHHALLVRIAAEQGQAPINLAPYLPVTEMPYHWGYHVFMGATLALSGFDLPRTMLWGGQVLNALQVVVVAALAVVLWRRPTAGLAAGVVVGLISIMPAYYTSWGRYTQLTGLLLLPPLGIVWYQWLRSSSPRWLACGAVLLAGLNLIHFRVLLFALMLLAVMLLFALLRAQTRAEVIRLLTAIFMMGAAAIILTLPWLLLLGKRVLLPAVARPADLMGSESYGAFSGALFWVGYNRWLFALALLAALWGLRRRSVQTLTILFWTAGLFLIANPWLLNYLLPAAGIVVLLWAWQQRLWAMLAVGLGMLLLNPTVVRFPSLWLVNNDVIVISLFLPLSLLIAGGSVRLLATLERIRGGWWSHGVRGVAAVGLVGVALWGAWDMRDIINPVTIIATRKDVDAITWVQANTPADAHFLINTTAWLPAAMRGADGGWWLLPLAGRWMSAPPVLFIYGAPEYAQSVGERNRIIAGFRPDQAGLLEAIIARYGITHIYLGSSTGPLRADLFANRDRYALVYDQAGVQIFAVRTT